MLIIRSDGKAIDTIKRKWTDIPYKCVTMLALPYGVDPDDTEKQKQCLENHFSKYFAGKSNCIYPCWEFDQIFRLLW